MVKLPNKKILGDKIENYLFFTNSHDGSSSLMAGISSVRVVCNNTLQFAMKEAPRVWKCRHTASIEGKKKQAMHSLGLAVNYIDSMQNKAEEMALKKIKEEEFFRRLFEINPMGISDKSKEETITRIKTIYDYKDDLSNFRGSAWGMYNAVADFVSNTTPLRITKSANEMKLNAFFDGNRLLQESQQLLMAA